MDASHGRWVCIALLGTLLSACGGGDNNTTSSAGSAGDTSTAASTTDSNTTNSNTTSPPSADETVSDSLDPSILSGSGAWWQPASNIDNPALGSAETPVWHVDNNGNALAVWLQDDGSHLRLVANRYIQGETSWPNSTAQFVQSAPVTIAGFDVAFSANGSAIVIWAQLESDSGTATNIYSSRFDGATWSSPVLVGGLGQAYNPKIKVDDNGNALAYWLESSGAASPTPEASPADLWVSRYTLIGGWNTPTKVASDAHGFAGTPLLEVNAAGNGVLTWVPAASGDLWAQYFSPTAGWSTAAKINTQGALSTDVAQLKLDASGNAYIAWTDSDLTHSSIWANQYTVGTGWGTATQIATGDAASSVSSLQLSVDTSENALILWRRDESSAAGLILRFGATHYVTPNGWSAAEISPIANTGESLGSKFAFGNGGNAMAIWLRNDENHVAHLWAKPYVIGGGWGRGVPIDNSDQGASQNAQVKFDTNGNALAVWAQYDSTGVGLQVFANRYEQATGWAAPTQISSAQLGDVREDSQIAFDISGNAMVIFGTESLWANRYVSGNGWGSPVNIDSGDGQVSNATLQIDPSGNAFAVWQQLDGTQRQDIWANRFSE